MIRFFKTIQPAALFTIPLVALVFWLPGFFKTGLPIVSFDSALLNWVMQIPEYARIIISIVLVAAGGIYLNAVVNKHEVLYRHSYLPAFFYVILMSFHRDVLVFHPLIISNLIIICALDRTFSLFKNDSPISGIFDSSFLVAVSTLIYFPSFILFFLFLYSINNLRSFSFREFMIAVVGFLLPFFFVAVYGFWTDSLSSSAHNFFSKFSLHKIHPELALTKSLIAFAGYLLLLIVLALVRLRTNFYRNAIKTRSTQEILFVFFILSVAGLFFLPQISFYHFTQLAIPFSVFLAYYFLSAKRRFWIYELAAWALIGLIMATCF